MFGRVGQRSGGSGKVCDFFLQGRCKFGDNCKYEHPASQAASGNNRFAALSGQAGSKGRAGASLKDMPYMISKDNIITDLKDERPIWPFSAYGPGKDAPRQLFGGAPLEQSPEEMRVMFYLAQASGNPQAAVEAEQQLYQQMNEQVDKVLKDPEGAVQYILAGDNEHPNRRDMVVVPGQNNPFRQTQSSTPFSQPSNAAPGPAFGNSSFGKPSAPFGPQSAFGQPSQPNTSSAFGQPSQMGNKPAFGQPSQSAFGQPSAMGGASAFGQPSQPGADSAYGQPSQPGATSAFGQPSQPGSTSAFGQPSQPGATSAFGQPSQPGTTSAFGQPSQLSGGSAFGAPSAVGGTGAFGQPSAPVQSGSAFGQPSQPGNPFQQNQSSPFAAAQSQPANTSSPFGQPSQAGPSPFAAAGQNKSSPFAAAGQSNTSSGPFGQSTQASASPFAQNAQQQGQSQNQANTSAVKSPFTSHAHPPASTNTQGPATGATNDTATAPITSYAQHANGQLRSWKGNAVKYVDGSPYFSRTGNVNDAASLERIWCPDGPPTTNIYMSEAEELYQKYGSAVEGAYRTCAEQGSFEGPVPLLAPTRAWTRYDI